MTKPRRCKFCREKFASERIGQIVHADCVEAYVKVLAARRMAREKVKRLAAARVERAQTKARREKLKSFAELEAECRSIVQAIARIRDKDDGCISCHMGPNYGGQWHGSHFRPAGNHPAVQFHLWNIHKACAQCNLHKAGNIGAYRPRLISKIGAEKVDWIESQRQLRKHDLVYRGYLQRFKLVMGKRLRRMKRCLV